MPIAKANIRVPNTWFPNSCTLNKNRQNNANNTKKKCAHSLTHTWNSTQNK